MTTPMGLMSRLQMSPHGGEHAYGGASAPLPPMSDDGALLAQYIHRIMGHKERPEPTHSSPLAAGLRRQLMGLFPISENPLGEWERQERNRVQPDPTEELRRWHQAESQSPSVFTLMRGVR